MYQLIYCQDRLIVIFSYKRLQILPSDIDSIGCMLARAFSLWKSWPHAL